jgi:carbon-monoxide dehydrogenase medium subunit
MKPAPFDYHRPASVDEALAMLASLDNAKLLAGGQSLVAMLNMRYAMPDHLVDINRLPELAGIDMQANRVTIGAMTRQCHVLANAGLRTRAPIFSQALEFVGHLQTRNRGTVGGSIGHMDPAAELMGLAFLLDATVHVANQAGKRDIAIADYPASYLTPSLAHDEMIRAVSFTLPAPGHASAFHEFAQRHGDFAIVGVAVVLEGAGTISQARIALIGVGPAPVRLKAAEELLRGQLPSPAVIAAAAECARGIDALEDAAASTAYRQRLATVLTRRALTEAATRLHGAHA